MRAGRQVSAVYHPRAFPATVHPLCLSDLKNFPRRDVRSALMQSRSSVVRFVPSLLEFLPRPSEDSPM